MNPDHPTRTVKVVTSHHVDVERLLDAFGLKGQHVVSFTLCARAMCKVQISVERLVTELEFGRMVDEFERNKPVLATTTSIEEVPPTTESES